MARAVAVRRRLRSQGAARARGARAGADAGARGARSPEAPRAELHPGRAQREPEGTRRADGRWAPGRTGRARRRARGRRRRFDAGPGGRMSPTEGNAARDQMRDMTDEAHASRMTVAGRALAANLSVFWKTARLYDARNVAYMQSLSNLVESVQQLHMLGSDFVLQVVGDCLYINDQRLKVDVVGSASHQFIVDELSRRHVGGLRFNGGVERSEIQTFTRIFLGETVQTPPDFEQIVELCQVQGVTRITPVRELVAPPSDPTDVQAQRRRMVAKKTFFRAIQSTKNVMLTARRGKSVDLRQPKRAVHGILDLILSQELSL